MITYYFSRVNDAWMRKFGSEIGSLSYQMWIARASTFRHVSPGRESRLDRFRSHIFSFTRRSRVRNSAFARFIFSVYNFLSHFLRFIFLKNIKKQKHLEVVLCIILMFFMLFLGKNFITCIVNIRILFATNKNKVSIIIWQPIV